MLLRFAMTLIVLGVTIATTVLPGSAYEAVTVTDGVTIQGKLSGAALRSASRSPASQRPRPGGSSDNVSRPSVYRSPASSGRLPMETPYCPRGVISSWPLNCVVLCGCAELTSDLLALVMDRDGGHAGHDMKGTQ